MIGKWEGEYQYDQYGNLNLPTVKFSIEILKSENGKVHGKVSDDVEMGGTPGEGIVDGEIKGNQLFFEKKMPIRAMVSQDGEHIIDESKKHPSIFYIGTFDDGMETVSGKWLFKKKFMWIGLLPWWYNLGSGTFSMKKVN